MSTILLNPQQNRTMQRVWPRLIPGEIGKPMQARQRKGPQSVRTGAGEFGLVSKANIGSRKGVKGLLLPRPLQSRFANQWIWSMSADFALITVSWLLMGALLSVLRSELANVRWFELGEMAAVSLLGLAMLHAALITLLGYTEGLHLEAADLGKQTRILGKSVLWATSVLCVAYSLQGAPLRTHGLFCGAGFLGFGALWIWRWWSSERNATSRKALCTRNVLVIGAGEVGRKIESHFERYAEGRTFLGFLDDDRPNGAGVVGRVADLARVARERFADEVILAAPSGGESTRRILEECRRLHLDVEIVPELFGCRPVEGEVERIGGMPAICVHAERLPSVALVLKRIVDVAGAGTALIALSPILLTLGVLIKLDSKGTVLYCAQRVGRKGQIFRCFKFRTMVSNADELKEKLRRQNERDGPFFKITGDPRITRIGRYLRRYSLDELPQLINVLLGDMSLVGPRPHPLDDFAGYELEHLARLDVTPGITGLWQVTARRDPSFHRGMELDREYIRNWSLRLDARILFKTFRAVMCGSGD